MTIIPQLGRDTRLALLASVGIAALAVSTPAFAQVTDEREEEEELELEEQLDEQLEESGVTTGDAIIVTGSRIATPDVETTAPVQVVTGELIESQGLVNVQEALLQNPAFGSPAISRTNSSFSTSASGIATIDLRNLGTSRTLTLINGRRVVAGVDGSSAVDTNMIPTALVERIEVLTSGGASAVYGSDAVAGVVNFIMKDDFQGVEIGGQIGMTEVGDSETYLTNITVGGNFDDGRGNAVLYAGYSNEGAAFKGDHFTEQGSARLDSISLGLLTGNDEDFFTREAPFFSSFPPQGRYSTDNFTFTYGENGNGALRNCFSTNGGTAPASCGAAAGTAIGPDGFNRSDFRYLAVPIERFMVAGSAHYEIAPAATVFVESQFTSTNARSNIEPFPFDTASPVFASGQYPIETLDPTTGAIVRNPFVPDAIYNDSSDTDGDGLRDIYFAKRLTDFGARRSEATRQTFRIVGGVRGDITPDANYEVFANYGQTDIAQLGDGQINIPNLREAAKIVPDGAGGFQCANIDARNDGCVPANWFGLNSLSPEAVSYLAAPSSFNAKISQLQVGATIGSSLFNISGVNPAAAIVGVEYRKETSSSRWDALQQQGLNGGNALPPTIGEFDVREAYGELLVPIIEDSFIESFLVRGAVRFSDYSTVGNTFSWNAGAELTPVRGITLRGMYSETVRAPNISELFDGLNQTFPTLNDPCEGVTATDTSALAVNCRAAPGVNANIAANGGVFTVSQPDRQGVSGFTGGNPNLTEEKGKTYTLGVVLSPGEFIPALYAFNFKVDYYNVSIDDAIVATPRQYIVNQCYGQGRTEFCQFIERRSAAQGLNNAGSLEFVNTGPSNSGGLDLDGLDVEMNFATDLALGSEDVSLGLNVVYSHLFDFKSQPLVTEPDVDNLDGEVGISKDRFTVNGSIGFEDVRLTVTGVYIGEAFLDDQFTGVEEGENDLYRLHPEFYTNAQLRFFASDNYEFYVGVNNLFDNKPIYTASIPGSSTTGQDAETGVYDALGRRFYAGAKLTF